MKTINVIALAFVVFLACAGACVCAFLAGRQYGTKVAIDLPEEYPIAQPGDLFTVTSDTSGAGVVTYRVRFAN